MKVLLKFKSSPVGWILGAILFCAAMPYQALSATETNEENSARDPAANKVVKVGKEDPQVEARDALNRLTEIAKLASTERHPWIELERFQADLYKAMAMDPSVIAAVPASQVPLHLWSNELTTDLELKLERLRNSDVYRKLGLENEFAAYAKLADQVIQFRKSRQFPMARAIAKRGLLETSFFSLSQSVAQRKGNQTHATETQSAIEVWKKKVEAGFQSSSQNISKKNPFAGQGQYFNFVFLVLLGVGLGVLFVRMNPIWFEKLTATPAASKSTSVPKAQGLSYAKWLREFEEILTRLKAAQLTHERRIEDVVKHTERMNSQAMGLYSDARIKNEANLEHRMSQLLKEIQSQMDQGQKLKTGERAYMHLMLEHCLKLCDAIERGSIQTTNDTLFQKASETKVHEARA